MLNQNQNNTPTRNKPSEQVVLPNLETPLRNQIYQNQRHTQTRAREQFDPKSSEYGNDKEKFASIPLQEGVREFMKEMNNLRDQIKRHRDYGHNENELKAKFAQIMGFKDVTSGSPNLEAKFIAAKTKYDLFKNELIKLSEDPKNNPQNQIGKLKQEIKNRELAIEAREKRIERLSEQESRNPRALSKTIDSENKSIDRMQAAIDRANFQISKLRGQSFSSSFSNPELEKKQLELLRNYEANLGIDRTLLPNAMNCAEFQAMCASPQGLNRYLQSYAPLSHRAQDVADVRLHIAEQTAKRDAEKEYQRYGRLVEIHKRGEAKKEAELAEKRAGAIRTTRGGPTLRADVNSNTGLNDSAQSVYVENKTMANRLAQNPANPQTEKSGSTKVESSIDTTQDISPVSSPVYTTSTQNRSTKNIESLGSDIWSSKSAPEANQKMDSMNLDDKAALLNRVNELLAKNPNDKKLEYMRNYLNSKLEESTSNLTLA